MPKSGAAEGPAEDRASIPSQLTHLGPGKAPQEATDRSKADLRVRDRERAELLILIRAMKVKRVQIQGQLRL